jgi:predicted Zn-dependent protease
MLFQDRKCLDAALGYYELKMYPEAEAELESFHEDPPSCEFLVLRVAIFRSLRKRNRMREVARDLGRKDPDKIQWALSQMCEAGTVQSIEAARVILLAAAKSHPAEAVVHYNLACYNCQLGSLKGARRHLARAFRLNAAFKLLAMQDGDLDPLWEEGDV